LQQSSIPPHAAPSPAPHHLRILVGLSLVVGIVYPLVEPALAGGVASVALKGACVGLLAVAAARTARGTDGWLLAGVMAAGTLGDILLGLPGLFAVGAGAFAVGHLLAIILYRRNAAAPRAPVRLAIAAVLLAIGLITPWLMLPPGAARTGIAVYAALLAAMAAAATLSRFAAIVPLGAVMFLVSDALIGARLGHVIANDTASGLAVWWLYYFGQLLIFIGVRRALSSRDG
jgi:uncharacterized membrane protein YhhN